jgi:hypothetical protein
MKWHEAIPIAVAVSLPLILGYLAFKREESSQRRLAHSEHRQALYESLIRSLVGLLGARTPEERSRLLTEIETGWLFASDRVLEASYQYLAVYDAACSRGMGGRTPSTTPGSGKVEFDDHAREELEKRLADVFAEMRRDFRRKKRRKSKTTITRDWAQGNVKIYGWGILSDSRASG